ncbi:MAG: histidinol dehydrogenase [Desulfobacterales bacterium]
MKIYDYPSEAAEKKLATIVNRGLNFKKKDVSAVNRILEEVRRNGDGALIEYVNRFDAPDLQTDSLAVTESEFREATRQVDAAFRRALNRATAQIESFHRLQLPKSWINTDRPGTLVGQMVNPVQAAGIYVPGGRGGTTPLVSSVLMGAIPARIAGVERIVMVTPPTRDGHINPHLLVAARKVGVSEIYKIGSAWAIAALTYGTATVPKVDVIVGPGNLYVTLAKKIVAGTVGIDMVAGPSEILVVADRFSDPRFIAADLLSQAEHDVLASSILITDERRIAEDVVQALRAQLQALTRREIAAASLDRYGAIMVVPDLDVAVDLANRIAPEHLELHLEEPFDLLGRIRNAGAVFLGAYTPEPVGDYVAGPNHVLPTAGTARFASALSVGHFIKKTSMVHYSKAAFRKEAGDITRLAETEGLTAHANAVRIRLADE